MATSNDPRTTTVERRRDGLSRYDLVLLVIPAAFLLAVVAAQVSSFALSTLLVPASAVSAAAVADGLFVNPPRRPDR
jgi:hypothetical protein